MEHLVLAKIFEQILDGYDIPKPEGMLKVNAKDAAEKWAGFPYSMADNLKHTVFWQNLWLAKLDGQPSPPAMEVWAGDWQPSSEAEWKELRKEFVLGLEKAKDIASSNPFTHRAKDDQAAIDTLIAIAVHASYHCGQINLMKRSAKLQKKGDQ